jgi:integrase
MSKLWIAIRARKDRPGKFRVDVWRDTERSSQTFDSLAKAQQFKRELQRAEAQGAFDHVKVEGPKTLMDLAEAFLVKKRKENLAPNTLLIYRTLLIPTVVPRIGADRRPKEITVKDVEAYRDARLNEVSPTTVVRELDRLRALLDYALSLSLIEKNVVKDVTFPKLDEEQHDWLRSTEIRPFLNACEGDFEPIALFTIFTGLRRGEVVFLQRSDIDFQNGVIVVRSKRHLGFRTKSGRDRSVPIDPTLVPHLETQLAKIGESPSAWVFPQRDGQQRSAKTRWFAVSAQKAALRAGIDRPLTYHDLRRTYGAMCIEAGMDIYTVSRLLGHADVRVTQKVYAPICGRFLGKEQAKLGRYLAGTLANADPKAPTLGV